MDFLKFNIMDRGYKPVYLFKKGDKIHYISHESHKNYEVVENPRIISENLVRMPIRNLNDVHNTLNNYKCHAKELIWKLKD